MFLPLLAAAAAFLGGGHSNGVAQLSHVTPAPAGRVGLSTSTNWSGYAAVNDKFKGISGTWVEPRTTCNVVGRNSMWLGLDGYNSPTVEQAGSGSVCNKVGAKPVYYVWWEMFPAVEQPVALIHAGDKIHVLILAESNDWLLQLRDVTSHKGFAVKEPCGTTAPCKDASAEAIAEAPTNTQTGQTLLPDYHRVSFQNLLMADAHGHFGGFLNSHWQTFRITQAINKTVLAQPTALHDHNHQFASRWESSGG